MRVNRLLLHLFIITISLIAAGCSDIPENARPVQSFEVDRYLGTWYEIARLDHKFERGLSHVTANYTLNKDGSIAVLNEGYNAEESHWKSAEGKAKFRGEPTVAALKVSFFGPFYSGYNVLAIDPDYQYALVAGKDLDFLWLLSRKKEMPEDVKLQYLQVAMQVGYNIDDLLWVDQESETTRPEDEG